MKLDGNPRIESVKPSAALPTGEVAFHGAGFSSRNHARPQVHFGTADANVMVASEDFVIARVPDGATAVHKRRPVVQMHDAQRRMRRDPGLRRRPKQ